MEDFLARIGLSALLEQLQEQGFDDMETLGLADKDDLVRAGLGVGHALKLLKSLSDHTISKTQESEEQSNHKQLDSGETDSRMNCGELLDCLPCSDSPRDKSSEIDMDCATEHEQSAIAADVQGVQGLHEQSNLQHARMSCKAVSVALEQGALLGVSLIEGVSFENGATIETAALRASQEDPVAIILVCMLSEKTAIQQCLHRMWQCQQPIIVLCVDEGVSHDTKKVRVAQSMFLQMGASDIVLQRNSGDLRLELEMKALNALRGTDERRGAMRSLVSVERGKGTMGMLAILDGQTSEEKDFGMGGEASNTNPRGNAKRRVLTSMHVPLFDSNDVSQSSGSYSSHTVSTKSSFNPSCRDITTDELHRFKCFKVDVAKNKVISEALAAIGYSRNTSLEQLIDDLECKSIIHLIHRLPDGYPESHVIAFMETLVTLMENLPHLHLTLPKECTWANRSRARRGRLNAAPSASASSMGPVPGSEGRKKPMVARGGNAAYGKSSVNHSKMKSEDLKAEDQLNCLFNMLDLDKRSSINFDQFRILYLSTEMGYDVPEATFASFAHEDGLINRAGFGSLVRHLTRTSHLTIQDLYDACQ